MEEGHLKCLQMRTGGEGYDASCVRTYLHYLFSCSCLMVSCFIRRNLTLPSFKKSVFVRNGYNFCCNEISFFLTLNCFSEPKLAKTVLILIKQNLKHTLNFTVTKILCSVARRFICEVNLHRYLQTLFYTIVIVAVFLTQIISRREKNADAKVL